MSETKTICVIGTNEFNLSMIRDIPEAKDWRVEPILDNDDVLPRVDGIEFDRIVETARERIDALGAPPDAIIGHLDFPVTGAVAMLNRHYGLRGASPETVALLEHKYWLRQTQARLFPDRTPACVPLNPFDPVSARRDAPEYPFWLKPVKAHSSILGMRVCDAGDLDAGLHACRLAIHRHGEPFTTFLHELEEIEGVDHAVDGNFAIAEEIIAAPRLFTVEGFVRGGEVTVYAVIETMRGGPSGSSLVCYLYPGPVPEAAAERARGILATLFEHIGFEDGPFNAEFFYDDEAETLDLLEVNPRISKSHSPLLRMVDGASHHRQMIQLALGEEPVMPAGEGEHPMAAKFMIRSAEPDGIVKRVPSEAEIAELKRLLPALEPEILVEEGQRLSELPDQEVYSYELADLFIGGSSREVIEDAYSRCRASLEFAIKPLPEAYP